MDEMKRVLIWGMAKSGVAAAKLLCGKGIFVRINDLKTEAELGDDIHTLDALPIDRRLGEKPDALLDDIDTVVISPGIPADHPSAVYARSKGIRVISEIELAYRLSRGYLVGVTGTNGKTTTTTLLGEIFKLSGRDTKVVGNIGEPYSAHAAETDDDSVTVCELSSFQLETIDTFRPDVSLMLNLTEDHLNRHKTMENYARIKERIFMNQSACDAAVFNYDDPITRDMAARAHCDTYFFSRKALPPHGTFVKNGRMRFAGKHGERDIIDINEILIPGAHNLENALAAACGALCAGIEADTVAHALRTFLGVEHRIESVRTVGGVTYINDSKGTNPDSTIKAIECMKSPTVILLGGSEKNSDYSLMARTMLKSNVMFAVLLGDTGEKIGEALKKEGFTAFEYAGHDFEKAIYCAKEHAPAGGNVLLSPACASFDMFRDFEHRGEEFKRIVNKM